ncbi:MAG: thioredoxin-dependent thiol peroxidase [Gemmatimonadetes bacterium]|nr:thioredoxin-dependent thiol peroxidase [Gemmatimonadota bacterium]MBI3567651.1 thioredoxin-dependent thiol peroxidase [Gemmatimonadota bacterium]
MPLPKLGKPAPDFELETDAGDRLALRDLRGRTVVLYFYPKDDTTGCTQEACEFRDLFPRFAKGKAVVLGISPDSARKHRNFKKKYDLPFTLLVDEGHKVAEAWGLWVEKLFWGRKYWGVARTTFIIDGTGRIVRIFEKVDPAGHAAEVEAVLKAMR